MSYDLAQAWEVSLLALLVWREARDQDWRGKLAVAFSVRNRVTKGGVKWWGNDWEEIIEKRWQYTSFEKSDPNSSLLPGDPEKDASWKESLAAAEVAYLGVGGDPSQGATHYYNPKVVAKPAWVDAAGTVFRCTVGDHWFYTAN